MNVKKRIWIVHPGELFEVDKNYRLFRYGILAEMLSSMGHEVLRFAPNLNHITKEPRFSIDTVHVVNERYSIQFIESGVYKKNISIQRILFYAKFRKKIRDVMLSLKAPDIILTAIPTPGMTVEVAKYSIQQKIPFVIDVRDLWPDVYSTVIKNRVLNRIVQKLLNYGNKYSFPRANAIFGVSESYLNWGLRHAGRASGEFDIVYPLAYKMPVLEDNPAKFQLWGRENGIDPEKDICIFLGQFEQTYNIETIINAAKIFEAKGMHNFQFVLCGSGSQEPNLRKMANATKSVIFPGWISGETINYLMSISKIGIAAYAEDAPQSLSNKPFEYMAGKLAILASLDGELRVLVEKGQCGYYYHANDAETLANYLEEYSRNPELLQRARENSFTMYKNYFSADKVYKKMSIDIISLCTSIDRD
jgi:glycosyltransferase involved in cell wall biosynthesis